jgi:hypothetical protein
MPKTDRPLSLPHPSLELLLLVSLCYTVLRLLRELPAIDADPYIPVRALSVPFQVLISDLLVQREAMVRTIGKTKAYVCPTRVL